MRWPGAEATVRDQRGVGLPEILVAVGVIAIGLVGVAVVVPLCLHAIQHGGQLSTATFLAEQMVERARAATWSTYPATDCLGVSRGDTAPLPADGSCDGSATTRFPDEPAVEGHPGYQRTVRVIDCEVSADCAAVSGAGARRVTVTVQYRASGVDGGVVPAPATVRLDWLAVRQ